MDIGKAVKAVQAIPPASQSAGNVEGSAIDTNGFHEALFCLNSGTNQATGTVDVKVQECATSDGTYADITDAAFVQVTTANDVAIYQGRVRMTASRKRYLRAYAVVAVAACVFGVVAILGEPNNLPAATPAFDIHG
ncbi:MAG TPA: hypothetical protein VMY35_04600 [Phycisphaerae bacterium]|nr:hypothetical protein [Phycisphaerae bacterium]